MLALHGVPSVMVMDFTPVPSVWVMRCTCQVQILLEVQCQPKSWTR